MRLKNAPGLYAPLLATAFSFVLGGCPTPVLEQPPEFSSAPTVLAIYATDSAVGFLNDVQLYSSTEPTRTSLTPPSYGGFRIEFSQPLVGTGVFANSDVPGTSPSTGPTSYCTELTGGSAIKLVDADDATIGAIKSSICYDPSSALGSHPNVVVLPGIGVAFDNTSPSPFTCQQFTQEDGSSNPDASGNVLREKHKYALKFAADKITGQQSKLALKLPTDAGWAAGAFTFTTDDFSLMAVGFQDQNTGYFTFVDKPAKGFLKDLDPVAAAAFVVPADDTPIQAIFSSAVADTKGTTVTRADSTSNDGSATIASGFAGDSRVVSISPGVFWESNGTYKVTIPADVTSLTGGDPNATPTAKPGIQLGKAFSYTFKSGSAAPGVRIVSPSAGSVAQSIGVGSINILVQEPVDPASISGFVLKKGTSVVPGAAAVDDGTNSQSLTYTFTDGTLLDPNTTYTIEAKGLKVLAKTPNAGQKIADFTSTFNTATFRSTNIFNGGTGLDRRVGASPLILRGANSFQVRFTNAPVAATVTNTSVLLGEVTPAGVFTAFDPSRYTVSATSNPSRYSIQITDTTYPLKFNQKYAVKLLTSIKDAASGQSLRAEGCTAADCSETRAFTTAIFAPTLSVKDAKTGKFTVKFNASVDPASVNDYVGTAYKLFRLNADGSIDPSVIVMSCTQFGSSGASATTTTCTTSTALALNTRYVASATFLQTATAGASGPARVAPTIGGLPTEAPTATNGSTFFGSRTSVFLTPCQ